jgi:site-specific DNA recombinase
MNRKISCCYLRYSSDVQNPATIDVQREQCEKTAEQPLVAYTDEAKTGKAIAGRDGLRRLLADAAEGKIDKVYCLRYDRLGRNEADTFTLVAELQDYGCEVISSQEGREAVSRGIHLVMAAHYSRELSIKTRMGQLKAHERQTFTGGTVAHGMKVIEKDGIRKLAINPEETPAVKLIFDSFLGAEPMGLKSIAKLLNDRAIATRSMKAETQGKGKRNPIGRIRKATPWTKATVRSILSNPVYTGLVVFNRRTFKLDRNTGRRVPKFNDASVHQSYQDESLRVITDEQFQAATIKLAAHKQTNGTARSAKLIRPFTGHLFCESCGSAFYSRKSANAKGVYIYYNCGCRQRRGPDACLNSTLLREDKLMATLQKMCEMVFADIDGMVEEVLVEAKGQIAGNKQNAERIRRELSEAKGLCHRLTMLLVDAAIVDAAKPVISAQLAEAGDKVKHLQGLLDSLLNKANQDGDDLVERTRVKLLAAKDRWEAVASSAQLNQIIADFVGPSVVTAGGLLLAVGPETQSPVHSVSVHGAIAGGGFEPPTSGL